MTGKIDFVLYENATYRHRVTYCNPDNTPVDLTGCTALMQVRATAGTPVLLELSTANGMIELGGVSGTIDIVISQPVIDGLSKTTAKHDFLLTQSNGDIMRLFEGYFSVLPGITQ